MRIFHNFGIFRQEKSQEKRNEISSEQISNWMEYVETRAKELPEKLKISQTIESELKDGWVRSCNRENKKVPMSKMLDFHYELASKYKMRVPIDPKNLAQMIHPHYGYLAEMPVFYKQI